MPRMRFSAAEIVSKLCEADVLLAKGQTSVPLPLSGSDSHEWGPWMGSDPIITLTR